MVETKARMEVRGGGAEKEGAISRKESGLSCHLERAGAYRLQYPLHKGNSGRKEGRKEKAWRLWRELAAASTVFLLFSSLLFSSVTVAVLLLLLLSFFLSSIFFFFIKEKKQSVCHTEREKQRQRTESREKETEAENREQRGEETQSQSQSQAQLWRRSGGRRKKQKRWASVGWLSPSLKAKRTKLECLLCICLCQHQQQKRRKRREEREEV